MYSYLLDAIFCSSSSSEPDDSIHFLILLVDLRGMPPNHITSVVSFVIHQSLRVLFQSIIQVGAKLLDIPLNNLPVDMMGFNKGKLFM
jgi:hypothetical protein